MTESTRYAVYIFLHLVGVVLFLGGFAASLFAKVRADRTRDPRIISHTFSAINFNDKWFTPIAIFLILIGGVGAAVSAGIPVMRTGWIFWALVLFGLSGLIFVLRALPLQRRIEQTTGEGLLSGVFDVSDYERESAIWLKWATAALILVAGAFVLMVFKPTIPIP